ncbi:MAG: hypothetical protein BRC25_01345 [Parcubacteria group bacterium SW_6_46_9]|nr:MAG: hypothetical protein BRC25_01345 [Parcubacteria group bacterium SW_6_46_9]
MNVLKPVKNNLQAAFAHINDGYQSVQSAAISKSQVLPKLNWTGLPEKNIGELLFWTTITATVFIIVLLISITRELEKLLDPLLFKIKRFAPYIMQITLGVSLIVSAHYGGLFGPQLPLVEIFGATAEIIQVMIYTGGFMLLFGIFPRMISFAVVLLSLPLAVEYTTHMLTHATYVGEALTIFAFGGAYHSLENAKAGVDSITEEIRLHLHKYKFAILRLFLGFSLIASAVYSRLFVATELETIIANTQLVSFFPSPSFLLFGLILLEVLFGLFFIVGFELRFASIAYLAFLIFSITLFNEPIWQSIILIGTPLAMFTHGYDTYTVGGTLFSRGNLEPIL